MECCRQMEQGKGICDKVVLQLLVGATNPLVDAASVLVLLEYNRIEHICMYVQAFMHC